MFNYRNGNGYYYIYGIAVIFSYLSPTILCAVCDDNRNIFTNASGVISDGNGPYLKSTTCEWLIKAPPGQYTITLKFISFELECSYDFLFIYDGDSFKSPLIASLSGDNVPTDITSTGPTVLVFLFSDNNYVLSGFELKYEINICPNNCSGIGICVNSACVCPFRYAGRSCEKQWCPNDCGQLLGKGSCDLNAEKCTCEQGYFGEACSIAVAFNTQSNTWFLSETSLQSIPPRSSHATVYSNIDNCLWVFGGSGINIVFGDLWKFSIQSNTWTEVIVSGVKPGARYHHAMVFSDGKLYLFGGEGDDGMLNNELWVFTIMTLSWRQVIVATSGIPLQLASHAAVLVDRKMYIFGGRTNSHDLSSEMYAFDVEFETWNKLIPTYYSEKIKGVSGHSMVYDQRSDSLIIYGGLEQVFISATIKTNRLLAFSLRLLAWEVWNIGQLYTPSPVALHSAVVMGDFMIVYGGLVHSHQSDETCYSKDMHILSLSKQAWVPIESLSLLSPPVGQKPVRGRFGHSVVLKDHQTLILFGGFRGTNLNDVAIYKAASTIVYLDANGIPTDLPHCPQYQIKRDCENDITCGWCGSNFKCYSQIDHQMCLTGLSSLIETDTCLNHFECESCTLNSQHGTCMWCQSERKCYSSTYASGSCNPALLWPQGTVLISSSTECQRNEKRNSLTFESYLSPKNIGYPDFFSYLSIAYHVTGAALVYNEAYNQHIVISGSIQPSLKLTSAQQSGVKAWLQASKGFAQCYLSESVSRTNKVVVANFTGSSSQQTAELLRPNSSELLPISSPNQLYYIDINVALEAREQTALALKWKYSIGGEDKLEQIPITILQPFESDVCSGYVSCRKCVTDYACGWCPTANSCVMRNQPCLNSYLSRYIGQCSSCKDYPDCHSCAEVPHCEWDVLLRKCYRSGLRAQGIGNVSMCASKCNSRTTCGDCLSTAECTWCSDKQLCFPFSMYIPSFVFGQCSTWLDSVTLQGQLCLPCSAHSTCDQCLSNHRCGWCYNSDYPLNGTCTGGDSSGPSTNQCSALVTTANSSSWSYHRCPDVNECDLGIANCLPNSMCQNTDGSFECPCNIGYLGDGKTGCERTCHPECIHGTCNTTNYECTCDIGWTGTNCSIDCGCHGHSTCHTGVGTCDQCQDNTQGMSCDQCLPGNYGNATSNLGCSLCTCNGHGDSSLNLCNPTSGQCHCTHNTEGFNCEKCVDDLAGEPRNGGICYVPCHTRYMDANQVSSGYISSLPTTSQTSTPTSCLWVLSTFPNGSSTLLYGSMTNSANNVPLSLKFKKIELPCAYGHIHVYDGVPRNPDVPQTQYVYSLKHLGSFCGHKHTDSFTVTAVSGTLTIHLIGNLSNSEHFVGFYQTKGCVNGCRGQSSCGFLNGHNQCICNAGWSGVDCSIQICPEDCNSATSQGLCHMAKGYCSCATGFSGPSCNVTTENDLIVKALSKYQTSMVMPSSLFAPSLSHINNKIYLFGGNSPSKGVSSEFWSWDISASIWTEVITNDMNTPPGRCLHCTVVYQNSIIIFGGFGKENVVKNDVWRFDISTASWTKLDLPGNILPSLMGHSCNMVNNKMYIIGGYNYYEGMNEDLLIMDFSTMTWIFERTSGFAPSGVFSHSAVKWRDAIITYGGIAFYLDDARQSERTYMLNTTTLTWQYLESLQVNKPPALFLHSAQMHGDKMFVFGGYSDVKNVGFNDNIYVWDVVCDQWTTIQPKDLSGDQLDSSTSSAGLGSTYSNGVLYIITSFYGSYPNRLLSIDLPASLCGTMQHQADCVAVRGCNWCKLIQADGTVSTSNGRCYAIGSAVPLFCNATSSLAVSIVNGQVCNKVAISQRSCQSHTSCVSCLATYPNETGPHCNWCPCLDNPSVCVSPTSPCPNCNTQKYSSLMKCKENDCEAASCSNCGGTWKCIWTRHFLYSKELKRAFSPTPIYPWNCFLASLQDQISANITDKSPPNPCPQKCVQARTCSACLASKGSEGGSSDCVWSDGLQQCLARSLVQFLCPAIGCGQLYQGAVDQCPASCSHHLSCSTCLGQAECGWCAAPGVLGNGICYTGGLRGPRLGTCGYSLIDPGQPTVISTSTNTSLYGNATYPPVWAAVVCPLENECLNGHSNCTELEDCIDLTRGFMCQCKNGYEVINSTCEPVCDEGCGNGECIRPNECLCGFGWTGVNCSVECQCNGNSNCANATHSHICIECHNHTKGASCESCLPLYVGDPSNGFECVSCYNVCNQNTIACVTNAEASLMANYSASQILAAAPRGPSAPTDVTCLRCEEDSDGRLCETCVNGSFKHSLICIPCQCNGHSLFCNKNNGTGCQCQHNTINDPECAATNCWEKQCSKCDHTLGYIGNPANGRQCYKKMSQMGQIDLSSPSADHLNLGQSVFFSIPPKYTNVHIQLIVDVYSGSMDVFISISESSFVVTTDSITGYESLSISTSNRVSRSVPSYVPSIQANTDHISTFVTYSGGVLHVIGVQRRLIITIPDDRLDFGIEKLFIAFTATGLSATNVSHGIAAFRQENAQIDLFVFFSVFLSIFFLILSNFVIGWKIKQIYHRRRRAHIQQVEMETMASRPYSSYTLLCEKSEALEQHLMARHNALTSRISKHNPSAIKGHPDVIYPLAVQQTEDERAAVVSVMVQLPGNELSDFNLSLGSCLSICNAQHLIHPLTQHNGDVSKLKSRHSYVSMTA